MQNKDVKKWLEKEVEISKIDIPAILQRKNYNQAALEELAQDIAKVGLINRVTVVPRGERYELVAGYRRLLAYKLLERAKIEVRMPQMDSVLLRRVTFAENYLREGIDPLDEAEWFAAIAEAEKYNQRQLALMLNRSESYVSQRLALLGLPEYLQQAIRERVIGTRMALLISTCTNDVDRKRILGIVRDNGASESVVKYWVDTANAEDARQGGNFSEEEFIQPEPIAYQPPMTFCDLCEQPADHMSSKFIRVCQDCFAISKANLKKR